MSSSGTLRGTPKGRSQIPSSMPSYQSSSNIPRPSNLDGAPGTPTPSDNGNSTLSTNRQKQLKRDEAIRQKAEANISKRKHTTARARHTRKAPPGTVLALRPSQALQIKPSTTVAEAAQMMAAKREDCVLVTDDDDRIAGIFTAKDLAFRVVGEGIKARDVTIDKIMTPNPLCAKTDTSATDALDLMVRKGFRHLPVMDENHDISGILDITKCFYDAMEKLERAYASSRALHTALEGVQAELGSSQPQQIIQYVEALRQKMSGPTLESVLTGMPPATVSVRTTVKEAAGIMKANHTTAVLVQDQGAITGIFTSKDVVLRVIAAGLDPAVCSVVRVMTPHPDFAPQDMSIQAALRKMHDGHYLNLPVMGDSGEIVGMVDVLKLTYATLDQINSMNTEEGGEGPAWNKFWLSLNNDDTESAVSDDRSKSHVPPRTPGDRSMMSPTHDRPGVDRFDSVMPHESASHRGDESPDEDRGPSAVAGAGPAPLPENAPFAFKFKAPSGRVHRLQVTTSGGIEELVPNVISKLGKEVDAVGGEPVIEDGRLGKSGFALSYLDNEGDTVSITTSQDLVESISLARQNKRDKVDLFVHDPDKAPIPATMNPHPGPALPPTPAESIVTDRKKSRGEESAEEEARPAKSSSTKQTKQAQMQEQIIAGVPNELLLPGAVGALAVVVMGVFIMSRSSNK